MAITRKRTRTIAGIYLLFEIIENKRNELNYSVFNHSIREIIVKLMKSKLRNR